MADKIIGALTAAGSVGLTDLLPIEPAGGPPALKATVAQVQAALAGPIAFKTGVPVSVTGTVVPLVAYSQALPALGANSAVEIRIGIHTSGLAGTKAVIVRLGGTNIYTTTLPAGIAFYVFTVERTIWNRGATNSQVMYHVDSSLNSYARDNFGEAVYAIATNPSATLEIEISLANAADTITLGAVLVVVWP